MERKALIAVFLLMTIPRMGTSLEMPKGPYLQNVTQTEITIMWETDRPASAEVQYGEQNKPQFDQSIADESQAEIHEVRLGNLTPETRYRYRVISEAEDGEIVESEISLPDTFSSSRLEAIEISIEWLEDSHQTAGVCCGG